MSVDPRVWFYVKTTFPNERMPLFSLADNGECDDIARRNQIFISIGNERVTFLASSRKGRGGGRRIEDGGGGGGKREGEKQNS